MDKSLALVPALQAAASGHPIADAKVAPSGPFLYPIPVERRIRPIEKEGFVGRRHRLWILGA